MTNSDLRNKAKEVIAFYTELGNELFKSDMRKPQIDCTLKGKCGGQYDPSKHSIRVNMVLFSENYDDYIENTLPHEMAHAFQRHIHGRIDYRTGRRIMPHGREWKTIMYQFGKTPSTTHNYNVDNSTQRTVAREYVYSCNCRSYDFTIIRHRRAQRQEGMYSCRKCNGKLKYNG